MTIIDHNECAAWGGQCECAACAEMKEADMRWAQRIEDERLEREEEERLEGHL
jgi:hypothetical protein